MAKLGRNDPCPCGSELKYKKCCLDQSIDVNVKNNQTRWICVEEPEDKASNKVVHLVNKGLLDEAELTAIALIQDYPDSGEGPDRLAMVYERQGKASQAADMYQKALDFTLGKDGYDEQVRDEYRAKIAQLRK